MLLRLATLTFAGTAFGAGVLAPKKEAIICQGGAAHGKKAVPNGMELSWSPMDSQPWDAKACVPQWCMSKWCDECNSKSHGLKHHVSCSDHPRNSSKSHCEIVKPTDIESKVMQEALERFHDHHCVHQDCLTGACDKCRPGLHSPNLKDGASAICSAAERGSFMSMLEAAAPEKLCVDNACIGATCLTCPCVPPACVPTADPDKETGYHNADGYNGPSACYQCDTGTESIAGHVQIGAPQASPSPDEAKKEERKEERKDERIEKRKEERMEKRKEKREESRDVSKGDSTSASPAPKA